MLKASSFMNYQETIKAWFLRILNFTPWDLWLLFYLQTLRISGTLFHKSLSFGGDKMIVKFVWSFSRNTEYFIIFKKLRISGFKATYQCYLKISGNHNFGDNNTAVFGMHLSCHVTQAWCLILIIHMSYSYCWSTTLPQERESLTKRKKLSFID